MAGSPLRPLRLGGDIVIIFLAIKSNGNQKDYHKKTGPPSTDLGAHVAS